MTLAALRPPAAVLSRVDSEIGGIVIHRVRAPDARTMASRAIFREELAHVVGVRYRGIVSGMTLVAVKIGKCIVAVRMALGASERRMCTREREFCACMIERRRLPGSL